jgi:hypothetical protein
VDVVDTVTAHRFEADIQRYLAVKSLRARAQPVIDTALWQGERDPERILDRVRGQVLKRASARTEGSWREAATPGH